MDEIDGIKKKAKAVAVLSLILVFARLAALFRIFITVGGQDEPTVVISVQLAIPCAACFLRTFILFLASGSIFDGVYKYDQAACRRGVNYFLMLYVLLIVSPILQCAIVGEPLADFLRKEVPTGRNWVPWVLMATGDAIMVRAIVQFRNKVLQP